MQKQTISARMAMRIKVAHVPLVSETRCKVSHEIIATEQVSPPTRPIEASQGACRPPGQLAGWQQWPNVGVAAETLVGVERAHQPARAITRLPPGHVAPSGHTRQALSHP